MFATIARFELRYLLRNPLLWATAACTFVMFFVATSTSGFIDFGAGLLVNAPWATLQKYQVVSLFFMFVTTSFVANVVLRDDETGFGPIIRSTRVTKFDDLFGRFAGAFAVAAFCMLLVPLAIVVGSVMPWADPAQAGPVRIVDHLYGYFVFGLPNLFIHSAIFFALATITRSMMATYLGVVGLVSGFVVLQRSFRDEPAIEAVVAMAEPFGARAFSDVTRYWTIAERNAMLPDLGGLLLWNRLFWIGIAMLCLAVAYACHRAAEASRRRKRDDRGRQPEEEARGPALPVTLPSAQHGPAAARALLWMRTRFEIRQIVTSPAFFILMLWGLYLTFFVLITQRDPDGRPTYPTTLSMIPEIQDAFQFIPLIIAIYYAGELVWRERDRRVHELVDASPLPNWGYVVPKTLAMAFVLVASLLTTVAASITVQLFLGYSNVEIGKYLLWYVLPGSWDMLLIAALAIFVQALAPHKAAGWGVMVLYVIWQQLGTIEHPLLDYGAALPMPLSDMNGAGAFGIGAWTLRVHWGAVAVLLLLSAHLLWRRGTELRMAARLRRARRSIAGASRWIAVTALVVLVASGSYAYYNTNVVNDYQTRDAQDRWAAELEKTYWKYVDLPQPSVAHVTLNVAVEPEERRVVTKGSYRLHNTTSQAMNELHVRLLSSDLELVSAAVAGARLAVDDRRFDYRIYRFDPPMQPGEERLFEFETLYWPRGFRAGAPNTKVVHNGTFLDNSDFAPVIGMSRAGTLHDPSKRVEHGLPAERSWPKLEDPAAMMQSSFRSGWTTSDVTVSTIAEQTPIAPGRRVSDVTRGDRRIARFVSGVPIHPFFSIQSARYAVRQRLHAGISLEVYYHPPHEWNVDRMLDAMAAAVDYYQANFGPYPFDHARIVEFPGYAYFARAFAGTIPYSEIMSFISDYDEPETIDHVTGVTAHELAHQYWAHQVIGAEVEGAAVLSETLANYSALMVVRKMRGEDHIRRHLQFALDRYLETRADSGTGEPPLARVDGESHIAYHKGSLAMYLLQQRLGEEAVNRALRRLLERYRFKDPPHPRSLELIELLRAEAGTEEERTLITDLFERITLYDLAAGQATAVRRPDGKWDVTLTVHAKKFYADERGGETETPLDERIEIGLFTAEPGRDAFDAKHVVMMERHPIRTGRQLLRFVTGVKPLYAGIDPYNFYIDRNAADNVIATGE